MGAIHQMLLARGGSGGGGSPASGDLVFLGSADVEPTGGGTPRWWDGVTGSAPVTVNTPAGVHSRAWDAAAGGRVSINLASSTLTPGMGVRFRPTSVAADFFIFRISDGGTGEHLDVRFVVGGNFKVSRDGSTTTLATSTGGHIAVNTWYYIELTAVINDSTGSFTCNLYDDSGTLLESISASGVDTRDGAGSGAAIHWATNGQFEDAYFDSTGQVYGRCQVEVVAPNGAGDLSQLTAGGTHPSDPNWTQVDEIPVSGAGADVVTSTGADQYDCYAFPNRSVSGTPAAVGVSAGCVTASGTANFNFICRIAGVTYEHSTVHTMTTSAKMFGAYWRNNPATGNPWSDSEINAAQFGIHIHTSGGSVRALYRATLVQL